MPHPLVQQIIDTGTAQGKSFEEIDHRAGYSQGSLSRWATSGHNPQLLAFIDYANTVGLNVELVPDDKQPIYIPAFLPVRRRRG